jgi:hypothetical protein
VFSFRLNFLRGKKKATNSIGLHPRLSVIAEALNETGFMTSEMALHRVLHLIHTSYRAN